MGSEMCIRDRFKRERERIEALLSHAPVPPKVASASAGAKKAASN